MCSKLGAEVVGSIEPRKPIFLLFSWLAITFIRALLWKITRIGFLLNKELRVVYGSDIVIRLGGEMYTHNPSIFIIFAHSYSLLLAKVFGKPYMILSQAIGPVKETLTRTILAKYVLNGAELITIRDIVSYNFLVNRLRIEPHKVHIYPDLAFSLSAEEDINLPFAKTGEVIGINISPHVPRFMFPSLNLEDKHELFLKLMSEIIDEITEKFNVVMIPSVTGPENPIGMFKHCDDRINMEKILANMTDETKISHMYVLSSSTLKQLKGGLSKCMLFIGCRMHSIVFAISLGIPSIGLAYSEKTIELFDLIGLSEYVVDLRNKEYEELRNEILIKFKNILVNHSDVAGILKNVSKEFKDRSRAHALAVRWVHLKKGRGTCFGCGTCVSACPNGAIRMVLNHYGEYNPKISFDRCNECWRCIFSC